MARPSINFGNVSPNDPRHAVAMQYLPLITATAMRISRRRKLDWRDLLYAGYLHAFTYAGKFDPKGGCKTVGTYLMQYIGPRMIESTKADWCARIHEEKTKLKRDFRALEVAARGASDRGPDPADVALQKDEITKALKLLDKLHPAIRDAIRLYYLEELTLQQVGDIQGTTREMARLRIKKGLEELRGRMESFSKEEHEND